jgi:ribonuclease HII
VRVLGIDEAGRGCVLGDLVVAGFVTETDDEEALRNAGAADSKTLAPLARQQARTLLRALGTVKLRRIAAPQIDEQNLNRLEEDAIVSLVRTFRPDAVRLDALGNPAMLPALQQRLDARLPRKLRPRWTIEPRADATFAVVGAASIFAKTHRDEALDRIRSRWGDLGSGYPSDPKTRAWLRSWARTGAPWPSFVRTRWATVRALAQGTLFGDPSASEPDPVIAPGAAEPSGA